MTSRAPESSLTEHLDELRALAAELRRTPATQPDQDCPICLDALTTHDAALTKCGHMFHRACVTNCPPVCPCCRAPFRPADLVRVLNGIPDADTRHPSTPPPKHPPREMEPPRRTTRARRRRSAFAHALNCRRRDHASRTSPSVSPSPAALPSSSITRLADRLTTLCGKLEYSTNRGDHSHVLQHTRFADRLTTLCGKLEYSINSGDHSHVLQHSDNVPDHHHHRPLKTLSRTRFFILAALFLACLVFATRGLLSHPLAHWRTPLYWDNIRPNERKPYCDQGSRAERRTTTARKYTQEHVDNVIHLLSALLEPSKPGAGKPLDDSIFNQPDKSTLVLQGAVDALTTSFRGVLTVIAWIIETTVRAIVLVLVGVMKVLLLLVYEIGRLSGTCAILLARIAKGLPIVVWTVVTYVMWAMLAVFTAVLVRLRMFLAWVATVLKVFVQLRLSVPAPLAIAMIFGLLYLRNRQQTNYPR